ncbi:hypothetical protein UFOVP693_27 [uncultured Caudovirales phage]|uniref:Uncharacterized protein n=1 Tax=uncultured Caudovirales phage TaxID=2100421 RepID=A0A6J5NJN7_9CAUD|nr:hypothetical protein UFOVP693_27 [uncultured Caudovirales phage]
MRQQKRQIVITPDVYKSGMSFGAMVLWGHANLIGISPDGFEEEFTELMGLPAEVIAILAQEIVNAKMDYWNRDF